MATRGGASVGLSGQMIKAGSILYGVLETGIDSDESSPVLARIVEGDLKGARLVGGFTKAKEHVVIKFNRISIPGVEKSVPISMYAIDQNTARTALASHVDHHYLLRYGGLFATSFLSGFGAAITTSGATIINNNTAGGGATTTNSDAIQVITKELSPFGLVVSALGKVGTQMSSAIAPLQNTAPTVYVRSGAGVGLLLISDFSVPLRTSVVKEG